MKSQLSCIQNLEVTYIRVCGGCDENLLMSAENTYFINITENLRPQWLCRIHKIRFDI